MTELEDDGGTFGPLGRGRKFNVTPPWTRMTPSGATWTPMGVFWDGSMGVPSPSTKVTPKCVDDIFSASLMLATDSMKDAQSIAATG